MNTNTTISQHKWFNFHCVKRFWREKIPSITPEYILCFQDKTSDLSEDVKELFTYYNSVVSFLKFNTKIKIAPSVYKGRTLIRILVAVSICKGLRRINAGAIQRITAASMRIILILTRWLPEKDDTHAHGRDLLDGSRIYHN